ncbi:MAG: uracil-DNA glycosylase [Ruminococcus sp.]|nr:uracil-DNA glycosylase [Ruminococcus sp.]MDD7671075.1 uracil-DNA glycosylase [Ruminococcus sp.]
MVSIGNDWDAILADEFKKPYYLALRQFLKEEYSSKVIYPSMYDIFNAFRYTPYSDVKVVLLGQDPYHGAGQAHGLCFSVKDGVAPPPSLVNLFKELNHDVGCTVPQSGCLTKWAERGVMLLNSVLTVREGAAGSHRGKGWETFTDSVISRLNDRKVPIVFMLWGNYAKSKIPLITSDRHLVLTAAHPSPLSASYGFFGCRHFSKANDFLVSNGMTPVDWQL